MIIERFARLVPDSILSESGAVFYSGRTAFNTPSNLYILGSNPGGSPDESPKDTLKQNIKKVLHDYDDEWSAYSDECWSGPPGKSGLQPRILHMLEGLDIKPRHVPASNVVFIRSATEKELDRFEERACQVWCFHQSVINQLGIKVVLCFGKRAGNFVAKQLKANQEVCKPFVEKNNRGLSTVARKTDKGIVVIIAAHPSRSNWENPKCDPTDFVRKILDTTKGRVEGRVGGETTTS